MALPHGWLSNICRQTSQPCLVLLFLGGFYSLGWIPPDPPSFSKCRRFYKCPHHRLTVLLTSSFVCHWLPPPGHPPEAAWPSQDEVGPHVMVWDHIGIPGNHHTYAHSNTPSRAHTHLSHIHTHQEPSHLSHRYTHTPKTVTHLTHTCAHTYMYTYIC